jgi:cytochrome c-L
VDAEPVGHPGGTVAEAAQGREDAGDRQAIAEGERIYDRWCQACHLPDGTGRIGPSLADDTWSHPRTGTDVGQFEIIYAGGAGAMQAFGNRLDQDEILKVIAFLETLQKE